MLRSAGGRDHLPAQPDSADPAARARGGGFRQGPRPRFQPPWRARGATGRSRLHRNEAPDRARDRAAHGHAQRRQPRPSDDPDPVQTLARASRQFRRQRTVCRRTSTRWARCSKAISPSPAATRANRPRSRTIAAHAGGRARRRGAARRRVRLETRGNLNIRVRPMAIKRCVGNLVANAQRHADHVEITAKREPQFVSIIIDDDGVGIPPEHREDVFRPVLPAGRGAQPGPERRRPRPRDRPGHRPLARRRHRPLGQPDGWPPGGGPRFPSDTGSGAVRRRR